MKKRIIFTATIFSLLTLFVSCEREKLVGPDPVKVATQFTVDVIAEGGASNIVHTIADSGSTVVITLKSYMGHEEKPDSVFVNGLAVQADNVVPIDVNKDYNVRAVFKMTKQAEMLLSKYWTLDYCDQKGTKTDYYYKFDFTKGDSIFLYTIIYYPFDPNVTYTDTSFNKTSRFEVFSTQGNLVGRGIYELKGDSIVCLPNGEERYKILELSDGFLKTEGLGLMGNEYEIIDTLISTSIFKFNPTFKPKKSN